MEEISVSVGQVSEHAKEVHETATRSGKLAIYGTRTIEALLASNQTASRAVQSHTMGGDLHQRVQSMILCKT